MKRSKKLALRVAGTAAAISTIMAAPAFAGRWQIGSGKNAGKWWYNNQDGTYAKNGWSWIDGDDDGVAECYYFDSNGWLVTGRQTPDGYTVNKNGAWVENGVIKTEDVAGAQNVVLTSGANEISQGTIELGSDMALGTEESALLQQEEIEEDAAEATDKANAVEAGKAPTDNTSGSKGDSKDSSKNSGSSDSSKNSKNTNSSSSNSSDAANASDQYSGPGAGSSGSEVSASGPAGGSSKTSSKSGSKKSVGGSSAELPKAQATELVEYARSYIGELPYVFGGTSLTSGTDCSGFTQSVYRHFGINIPRDSRSQYASATKISAAELKPGDLVFYASGSSPSSIYHVGIYTGNGTIVHNTHSGDYVREHDVFYATPYAYGRYTK